MSNLIEIHPGVDARIRLATVKVKDKTHVPRLTQLPQISDAEEKQRMMDFFCPPDRHLATAVWERSTGYGPTAPPTGVKGTMLEQVGTRLASTGSNSNRMIRGSEELWPLIYQGSKPRGFKQPMQPCIATALHYIYYTAGADSPRPQV